MYEQSLPRNGSAETPYAPAPSPITLHDYACQLFTRGLEVFSVPRNAEWRTGDDPHSVYVMPQGWRTMSRSKQGTLLGRWRDGDALCLKTGAVSGLAVVDVDTKNGANVEEHRQRLEGLSVEILGEVATPSGGAHFYTLDVGLRASSTRGVDYQAAGNLAYLPGTVHPAKPGAYRWVSRLDLGKRDELDRDDQAAALCAYLTGAGMTPRVIGSAAEVDVPQGESLDVTALKGWLRELLADLGPQWTNADGAAYSDNSARFHNLVNACQRHGLTPGETVTALEEWVAIKIPRYLERLPLEVARSLANGKATTAKATPARTAAPPAEAPAIVDVTDTARNVEASPAEVDEWPTPTPLETTTAPPMPLDGLPALVRDVVEAYSEAAQCPPEVVLGAVLGAAAAATRGVWDIPVIRPDGLTSYDAGPTVLYIATLAASGERKDGGQNPILEPLREAERQVRADVRAANRQRERERKRLAAQLKTAEQEGHDDEAARLTEEIHAQRARPVPELMISDTTPEALGVHLAAQGGAAAVFSTEATVFRSVAGAYSDAGGNYGLLNHAYDGEPFSDLRVKRAGIRIERAAFTWCTAVQPEVMARYANGLAVETGFLPRFLLMVPESRVGHRTMRPAPVPAAVRVRLTDALMRLHAVGWDHYTEMIDGLPDELGKPRRILLRGEAHELHATHAQALEHERRGNAQLAALSGWLGKHDSRLVRIAALFTLLDDPYADEISAEAMRQALTLSRPIIAHALAALSLFAGANGGTPEDKALAAVRELGKPSVTTRELHVKLRRKGLFEKAADVREVLENLEELGWVRHYTALVENGKGGRPSEAWHVHPGLVADGEQK